MYPTWYFCTHITTQDTLNFASFHVSFSRANWDWNQGLDCDVYTYKKKRDSQWSKSPKKIFGAKIQITFFSYLWKIFGNIFILSKSWNHSCSLRSHKFEVSKKNFARKNKGPVVDLATIGYWGTVYPSPWAMVLIFGVWPSTILGHPKIPPSPPWAGFLGGLPTYAQIAHKGKLGHFST